MILSKLADAARIRVERAKERQPLQGIKRQACTMEKGAFAFEHALRGDGMAFICEVKKASPSKGVIAEEFPYLEIAKEYEAAGAAAISVLTEPEHFLGQDAYLEEIARTVRTPVLRKDFTVDAYQIYEAKILGASAVLLICALLDTDILKAYIDICKTLGLSALVEAHSEEELHAALEAGATVIGVNNRDLKTFDVDISLCTRLRPLVPSEITFVAESGIKTRDDVKRLEDAGVDAVLIGEALMREANKRKALDGLRGVIG